MFDAVVFSNYALSLQGKGNWYEGDSLTFITGSHLEKAGH